MPELPEVEVVRRGLERWVTGRQVRSAQVRHPRAVRRHLAGSADFEAALPGRTVVAAHRRGKYLWLALDNGDAVLAHLGMSGQLLIRPAAEADEPHLRVTIDFADEGPQLRFVDQRTFGGMSYERGGAELPAPIAHIARDPIDPAFDEAAFGAALRRRRTEVKRALLDQSLISGVGNIYADEALWRARVHWATPTARLTAARVSSLLGAIREVMGDALAAGGTSFDSLYVNVNGESGYFSRSLAVYGRRDQPCPRCGRPIVREPFMNRSSFRCPRCQPRPRGA